MAADKQGTFGSETRGCWATGQVHVPQQTCGFWPEREGENQTKLLWEYKPASPSRDCGNISFREWKRWLSLAEPPEKRVSKIKSDTRHSSVQVASKSLDGGGVRFHDFFYVSFSFLVGYKMSCKPLSLAELELTWPRSHWNGLYL